MKRLRQATIKQIVSLLDNSLFTRHAFEYHFNNDNGDIINIIYKDKPDYFFKIRQNKPGNNFIVTECPGITFTDAETISMPQFSQTQGRIIGWLQRIVEDLAIHTHSEHANFDALRKSINKTADELDEPEKPFSESEAKEWEDKLDKLIEKFERLKDENQIQQAELNTLRREVDNLKSQVNSVPKKVWVKAAGNKIINVFEKIANSKAGQKAIETTVKILLGG